jgi:hypothetical protein
MNFCHKKITKRKKESKEGSKRSDLKLININHNKYSKALVEV